MQSTNRDDGRKLRTGYRTLIAVQQNGQRPQPKSGAKYFPESAEGGDNHG